MRTALIVVCAAAVAAVTWVWLASMPATAWSGAQRVDAQGVFVRYAVPDGSPNPVLAGATARVHAVYTPSGETIVTLVVDGLTPDRAFGSHVHKKACGATDPAASSGHYQNVPGTANATSEVWLDFTTDDTGHGEATAVVHWHFLVDEAHPEGAHSVVVHRDETAPGGAAGPRLACLTVPFTS